jgi:hypothetical protein
MDQQTQQQLIEAAILAPSADNSQPWRYRWDNAALELWIDETRSGGFSDQRFVLSDLALGTCIENIVIRAHSLGYGSQVEYLPDPEQAPLWAARVTFSPTPKQEEELALAIPKRHTDRSFPWKGPITDATKQLLSDEAAKLHGVKLIWLDGTPAFKTALKAMWLAESLRVGSKELHQELFTSIRFDIGKAESCEEGLAPATLAIEPPLKPAFKALRHWPVMKILNRAGGNYLIGFRSAVAPTLLSPALCLLAIEETERTDIIQAGQALQRLWLKATAEGLTLQPFAAAGILTLGFIKLPASLAPTQRKITALIRSITGNDQGMLLLRLGLTPSTPAATRNQRRAVSTFLK